jgi:eukaryotic-like serine/threonine-protein kinase
VPRELRSETAHILFVDVVSYSTLPMEKQNKTIDRLQSLVQSLPDFQRAASSKEMVSLPTGDGMALVFSRDLEAPVRCAQQMSLQIRNHPGLDLRMGIHTGPVYHRADINENRNISGSGINIAQRVMDCGDKGHILLSKSTAEMLAQFSTWSGLLHDLGEVQVKHGVKIHLVNFFSEQFGNPEVPSKLSRKTKTGLIQPAREFFNSLPTSRRIFVMGGAGAIMLGSVGWFWPDISLLWHPLPARRHVAAMMWPKEADPARALVVRQLLVAISRELARAEASDQDFLILESSSSWEYGADSPSEAAGVLGANLVLAASLAPSTTGFSVALSVVDPTNPSNPFRRGEVSGPLSTLPRRAAQAAARLLGVRLSPSKTTPGEDFSSVPEAYDLLVKARQKANLPNNEGLDDAIELYQSAVRQDARFGAAYAGLAIAYTRRYAVRGNLSDLELALGNSKLALAYSPNSSRSKLSHALVRIYTGHNEEAIAIFIDLLKANPGDEEILMYEARAFREMNKPDLEAKIYQSLLDQRPNFWPAYNELGLIFRHQTDYDGAINSFKKAITIAPSAAIPWNNLGAAYFAKDPKDTTGEARKACLQSIVNHPTEDALATLGAISYTARNYNEALDYYERARDLNPDSYVEWQNIGDCYTMLNNPGKTIENYRRAAELLAARLKINARFGSDWMTMAYYSSKLGNHQQALSQLEEAEKRGASDLEVQLVKAECLVLLDQKEKAIDLIVALLKRGLSPSFVELAIDLRDVLNDRRLRAVLDGVR